MKKLVIILTYAFMVAVIASIFTKWYLQSKGQQESANIVQYLAIGFAGTALICRILYRYFPSLFKNE